MRGYREGRWRPLLGRFAVVLAIAGLMYVTPTNYFLVLPGVTRNPATVIKVAGGEKEGEGRFLLTTVSTTRANVLQLLYGYVHPRASLVHQRAFLPDGVDWGEYLRETRRMMEESQAIARVVALKAVGLEATLRGQGVRVTEVVEGSPAAGILREGDIILAVNGRTVELAEELMAEMERFRVGEVVTVALKRDERVLRAAVPTAEHPFKKGKAALRIKIETVGLTYSSPVPVDINAGNISGPSAGLVFALEIIDQLTPGDLTGGRVIAATGTITSQGVVGSVGGVRQKVWSAERDGAELFLVPVDNAEEARAAATRLRVVPVSTLDEALRLLDGLESRRVPQ